MKKIVYLMVMVGVAAVMVCCNQGKGDKQGESVVADDGGKMETPESRLVQNYREWCRGYGERFSPFLNSIDGHDERDTIIGRFDGVNIDTLYVDIEFCDCVINDSTESETHKKHEEDNEVVRYYMRSTNPKIPVIELHGCVGFIPKLVNEGDLDGNGTCEWGYLHTWINSQWRFYRVYTLMDDEWRYLTYDDLLSTNEFFRMSGYEVLEPGPKKGYIKINYLPGFVDLEIRDTVMKPTYLKITDD